MLSIGSIAIKSLRANQKYTEQPIRDDGPPSHMVKQGTPTMGGLVILPVLFFTTAVWADVFDTTLLVVMLSTLAFGAIGFYDDYLKVSKQTHRGLSVKKRLILEFIVSIPIVLYLISICDGTGSDTSAPMSVISSLDGTGSDTSFPMHLISVLESIGLDALIPLSLISSLETISLDTSVTIPFLATLDLGLFYIPLGAMTVVLTSNSVNIMDGVDGLAISSIVIVALAFAVIACCLGDGECAGHMGARYMTNGKELTVLLGAVIGVGLGFLKFNAPTALVFMGDTGALALGALLGAVAVATKHELFMVIIGGAFVIEATSVVLQVVSFKLTGKRILIMAPLHHHLELLGWKEMHIVVCFCFLSFIFGLIGLLSLII